MSEQPDPRPLPQGIADLASMFCCGAEEGTWGAIQEELERCERHEFRDSHHLAAAIADYFALTEHGTSVRGAWLTPKGQETLAFLQEHGWRWDEAPGGWVDPEGIHHGKL